MEYPPPPAAPSMGPTDTKILTDLSTVQEKIKLCRSMLIDIQHTSQIDTHEALLTVIGFLEACAPRVRELINNGMTTLKEETLTECFTVNDDLCKILDDVEHPEQVTNNEDGDGDSKKVAATDLDAANAISDDNIDVAVESLDFDAFGFEDQKQAITPSSATTPTTTTTGVASSSASAASALEDLLAPPAYGVPPPNANAVPAISTTPAAAATTKSDPDTKDEFDDFFDNRADKNSFSIDE